jgi:hypothetical protein
VCRCYCILFGLTPGQFAALTRRCRVISLIPSPPDARSLAVPVSFATFAHGRTCFPAYFIRETIFLCVLES